MRRYWIAPDASHNVNNSESAADYVCNRIADVVKKFHAAYLDFAPIDSQLLVYLNDPFLDFSTNGTPIPYSDFFLSSTWCVIFFF